jgi:tRNA threonylcarbamoyladenosine biosynthesis protein TsaE
MTDLSTTPSAEAAATPPKQGGELFETRTADHTFELGSRLAKVLQPGDVVLLYGGLGAGKTLFTKGVMAGLGYDLDEVTSPSFSLVNLYKTKNLDVYHIDLWRIDGGQNASEAVGLDEIIEVNNTVVLIEWADRLGKTAFPGRTISIKLEGDGDDPRKITVSMPEDRQEKI